MRPAVLIIGAGAALLAFGAWRKARRAQAIDAQAVEAEAEQQEQEPEGEPPAYEAALDYFDVWGAMESQYAQAKSAEDVGDANVRAFLAMIRASEGTDQRPDPYRVCYGYRHTISDLSEHPAVSGEWRGEKLPASICAGAGMAPGCVSTAAGAYQIIRPTWKAVRDTLKLSDFGPASQDAAAAYLIRQRGAMDDVRAGRFAQAVAACAKEWASLPGAGYAQPERKLATLEAAYIEAGGVIA